MMRFVFWIVAGLIGAGLVHGASLLMIPWLAPATAFDRLADLQAENKFVLLPTEDRDRKLLPFEDPTFVEAVCLYDLAGGPLRVFAPFTTTFGSVTFYTRFGQAFYSLTDRAAAARDGVNVVVLDQDQIDSSLSEDATAQNSETIRIVSPTPTGFVLLRLHVPGPTERAGLEAIAKTSRCAAASPPP
jgi:uncharacterized membrane protein